MAFTRTPNPYLQAYSNCAREVARYDGVLGVGVGPKLKERKVNADEAIVVLVAKKNPDREALARVGQLIPAEFNGYPTDVREMQLTRRGGGAPGEDAESRDCLGDYHWMDWGLVHELNTRQRLWAASEAAGTVPPDGDDDLAGGITCERRDNLFIINDPNGSLETDVARITPAGHHDPSKKTLDFVRAYRIFRRFFRESGFDVAEHYDLISFYVDVASGLPNIGNASTIVFNDVDGIGLPQIDNRAQWGGSRRLVHITHHCEFTLRTLLHEIGHLWCAYVNYRETEDGERQLLLHEDFPEDLYQYARLHWGRWVEDGVSCMDYDRSDWVPQADGTFLRVDRTASEFLGIGEDGFGYSPLDLYLMGLIPANVADIPDWLIVRQPTPVENGKPNMFDAPNAAKIGIANVLSSAGPRNPDHLQSQRLFQQATIVITKGGANADAFIANCDAWRRRHEINFRRATGGRAILDTTLQLAGYDDIYIRHTEGDTGDGAAPNGMFWESPDLWVRNNDDNQSEPQSPLRRRMNFIYARVHNRGTTTYDNVKVNFYLFDAENEAAARENFRYPAAGGVFVGQQIIKTLPPSHGASNAPNVKHPWILDPVAYKHPFLICEIIPRDSAPLTLHRVSENRKLAQRELTIAPP